MGGRRPLGGRVFAVVLAAVSALAIAAPAATAAERRDAFVTSFDGTRIWTHYFPGEGVTGEHPAPTILVGPGWSMSGETDVEGGGSVAELFGLSPLKPLHDAGYNILTWDPRGFGSSGGTVQIDDPRYEGRDVQALIDHVADQPDALLDRPGDPRLGMSGGSYGGGIQLVTAAIDRRVDAIVPSISWHSLVSSLFKAGSVKMGWGLILGGTGVQGSVLPGVGDPLNNTGHQDPHFYSTITEGLATGSVSEQNSDWFDAKGPAGLVSRIKAPTLLVQGTVDTLFTLQESIDNFEAMRDSKRKVRTRRGRKRRRPVPLKMIWFCGGHGVCRTETGPPEYVTDRTLAWFDRYLKRRKGVDTGPRFAWVDEAGTWRDSSEFPLRRVGTLKGSGSGTLPLVPGPAGGGALILATPAPAAFEVPIEGPKSESDIVGVPRVKIEYTGTGAPAHTHVYAQIVDPRRNIVVGNVPTPVPVELDGKTHSLNLPLEPIASRTPAGGGYRLQLTSSTTVYDIQRSVGAVNLKRVEIALPVSQPTGR
jgi:ABC-2 type transport system ATP-binding protein